MEDLEMKNHYEAPVMELLGLDMENVITASPGGLDLNGGGNGNEGGETGWGSGTIS